MSSQVENSGAVTLYIPIEGSTHATTLHRFLLESLTSLAEHYEVGKPEIHFPDLWMEFPSMEVAIEATITLYHTSWLTSPVALEPDVMTVFYLAAGNDTPWQPPKPYGLFNIVAGPTAQGMLERMGFTFTGGVMDELPPPSAEKREPPAKKEEEPVSIPEEPARPIAPPTELLSDEAIRLDSDDVLGLGQIAESISLFIHDAKTKTPLVISINAPWGAGKTSLTNLIASRLAYRDDIEKFNNWIKRHDTVGFASWLWMRPIGSTLWNWGRAIRESREDSNLAIHSICKFNAWLYDDSPSLTGTFAREITRRANECRRLANQMFRATAFRQTTAAVNFLRFGVYCFIFSLFYASPWYQPTMAWLRAQAGGLTDAFPAAGPLTLAALFPLWEKIKGLTDSVTKYASDPESVAAKGQIYRVRERLGGLLQQATSRGRKFIIMIDDLERCKPENALAILDLVNQLLTHPNVVVIIVGDMSMIAASAGSKFKDHAKLMTGEKDEALACLEYGQRYLQKVVQMQFDLPPPERAKLVELTKTRTDEDITAHKTLSAFLLRIVSGIIRYSSGLMGWLVGIFEKKVQITLENIKVESDAIAEGLPHLVLTAETRRRFERAGIRDEAQMAAAIERAKERYASTADSIQYLVNHFDLSPRQVKRYENMLRILFRILADRGVAITGDLPKQVAKWTLLQNEWPTFIDKIGVKTTLMKDVEAVVHSRQIKEILEVNFQGISNSGELARTLAIEPPLGEVAATLVTLKPNAPPPDEGVVPLRG